MAYEFKLPDIGEGVVDGEIVKWLVNEGDEVQEDQPLVEVMTDKATVTIPSPKKGRVLKLHGDEGSIAKVHEPLVTLDIGDGAAAGKAPPAAAAKAEPSKPETSIEAPATHAPTEAGTPPSGFREPAQGAIEAPRAAVAARSATADQKVLATPVTRRLAREYGIDLSEVEGSGPQGRVLKRDILALIEDRGEAKGAEAPRPEPRRAEAKRTEQDRTQPFVVPAAPAPSIAPPSAVAAPADERMPMRGLRKAIFRKMVQSEQFAVPFTYVDEVDCTELVALRKRINERFAGEGVKLTFLPFIIKALVAALKKHPHLNAVMDEEKQELVIRKAYNIGIGVATDAGLTVAVIHDADRRSMRDLALELDRLATAARENKLTMDELTGSTFTITSLGKEGGMFATPVINHPEVGILGIHRIEQRPVVIDGQIVVRDRMYMSCSFDHRVIDGHIGATFVGDIIRLLQDPERLLIEMT